jgi:hypothetical protein
MRRRDEKARSAGADDEARAQGAFLGAGDHLHEKFT